MHQLLFYRVLGSTGYRSPTVTDEPVILRDEGEGEGADLEQFVTWVVEL